MFYKYKAIHGGYNPYFKGPYQPLTLRNFFAFIFIMIAASSCGGGGSGNSNGGYTNTDNPIISSASASSSPIQIDISYKATGPCADGSEYTLTITGGQHVSAAQLEKMICRFFSTYPKIVALVNPQASKNISFIFDPFSPYIGVARGTEITYLPSYLAGAPDDIDIVVHEVTHAAQTTLISNLPSWIVEGTADFVRDLYGLDSKNSGWSVPIRYVPGRQHYMNGYGDTAAFFKWIDAVYRQHKIPVAAEISRSTLTTPYTDEIWITLTGKSLDALWNEYKNFPVTEPFTTGVSVFTGENFTGREIKLERGNYDLHELLTLAVPDNQIASIKVPSGYTLRAYIDVNFAGEHMTFTTDTPMIDDSMSLKISSIVVE